MRWSKIFGKVQRDDLKDLYCWSDELRDNDGTGSERSGDCGDEDEDSAIQCVCVRGGFDPAEYESARDAAVRGNGGWVSRYERALFLLFNTAYTPRVGATESYGIDQLKGLQDWINERYDIDARIADEDRAEWQKPESQKVMLQAMLQAMFADRCNMVDAQSKGFSFNE